MATSAQLPRVELGNTGKTVSRLCIGGFHQLEISSEIVHQVVDRFLDHGGNYIETARGYGNGASESKIGRALAGRRDQVVLASKSGHLDYDGMKRDIETSLQLLQTDHMEFYFLHGVNSVEEIEQIEAADGALKALQEAMDAGHVGGIGFSSHRPWVYLDGLQRLPLSVILIWDNYLENQYLPQIHEEVYPLAREKGVGITAMKPLGDGFLYRSPEAALRYALGSGADVLVCGMNSVGHVDQAASALARGAATAAERAEILKTAPELGDYVCRQCDTCPASLKHLFRIEGCFDRQMIDYLPHDPANYALRLRLSGWFDLKEHARDQYRNAEWHNDDLEALAAGIRCPYNIDVARKTRLTVAKLTGTDLNTL